MKKLLAIFSFAALLCSCGNDFSKKLTIPEVDESQLTEEQKKYKWDVNDATLSYFWSNESNVNQKDKADGLEVQLTLHASNPIRMPNDMARSLSRNFKVVLVSKSNPRLCELRVIDPMRLQEFFSGRVSTQSVSFEYKGSDLQTIYDQAETFVVWY